MKIAVLIARILLGAMFLVSGLNDLHPFIPMTLPTGDAGALMGLMSQHGWLRFHGVLFVIAGVLLLIGRYVPVALVILGPFLVNILLFHITFQPQGIAPGLLLTVLELFLIWAYWPAFRPIFTEGLRRV